MVESKYIWIGAILLIIMGTTVYTFQDTGKRDLCVDGEIWSAVTDTENLFYCQSEENYRYCSSLTATKRSCYVMELIGEYEYTGKAFEEGVIEKTITDIPEGKFIEGAISHTGQGLRFGNKRYSVSDAIKFEMLENGRFELSTIDSLECNFLWDTPTDKIDITNTLIDFKQGRFSDIKCNQEYSQVGDIMTFASGWIIDIDPSISHTSGSDWDGIFNFTQTDTENITLSHSSEWLSYIGNIYTFPVNPYAIHWNGSDWFISGFDTGYSQILQYNEDFTSNPTNFSVAAQDSAPQGIYWNGSNWFMIGRTSDTIYEFDSNWTITGNSWNIGAQDDEPRGIWYNGSNWFMVGYDTSFVHEYDSNWVVTGNNWSIINQDTLAMDIYWDGTNWWLLGDTNNAVFKYDSNWTYTETSFGIDDTQPRGFYKTDDNWFLVGDQQNSVYKYSTAFESSGTYTSQVIDATAESTWDYLNWSSTPSYSNTTGGFNTFGAGASNPYSITFDTRDNSFWVTDASDGFAYHFDSNGDNTTGGFSKTPAGAIIFIGIAFDSSDNSFWITDSTAEFVFHFDSNGDNTTGGFGTVIAGADDCFGITIDSRDNSFWITDSSDKFVYHFNSGGINISGGFSVSDISAVKGIAFDSRDNSFWIIDSDNDFAYHFDSNGVSTTGDFYITNVGDPRGIAFDSRDNSFWVLSRTDYFAFHYAQPIKFQATSCADSGCSDGTFVGPANTTDTYFLENISLNTTLTPGNRYFQYKAFFETPDTSFTPYLMSVDIGYTTLEQAPTFFGSSFLPSPAYSNSTLNASIGCKDAENDSLMEVNISWWKEDQTNISFTAFYANGSFNSWYLPSKELLDNQIDGIFNMTGNVGLWHLNNNDSSDTSGNSNDGAMEGGLDCTGEEGKLKIIAYQCGTILRIDIKEE